MDLAHTTFFGVLRTRLDQLAERQRLIAENIANATTPGYRPRDLDTSAFERALASASQTGDSAALTRTHPGHLAAGGASALSGAGGGGVFTAGRVVTRDDSETTIDGNAVILEEEAARATETRMSFESGIALYQKGLELIRLAARGPGRG